MGSSQQSADIYDAIFREGGQGGTYDLPYRRSAYYPLFRQVLREILRRKVTGVLEVGCGTGGFANLLFDRTNLGYTGFDFSEVAVSKAIARTTRPDAFFVGDATDQSSYAGRVFDCIVCTEVLEHIEADMAVISNWKPGVTCICSVPNFDADTHVRHFRSVDEVRLRYRELIDIDGIVRIRKPVLSDISTASVLRALRWNRYRPRRLLEILGITSFASSGGWYLFSGVRR